MPRISFILNHELVTTEVSDRTTVLNFLRMQRGLTGTKEVCNEGDCGACTVAVGELSGDVVRYRAVNSCLMPAVRMHQRHIVTVEGLTDGAFLHPVQQSMLDHHAVQCGYCTSGVVMAMFCLFAENPHPTEHEIVLALDGTLCRCTGYAPIKKAAESLAGMKNSHFARPEYFGDIVSELRMLGTPLDTEEGRGSYCLPESLEDVFGVVSMNNGAKPYTIMGGGTDLMSAASSKGVRYERIVDLSRVRELRTLSWTKDKLILGGSATLADLLASDQVCGHFSALESALEQMCSAQVRSVATLAGNLATASPIADTIPVLMVYDASVVLRSEKTERRLEIGDFLKGYRQTDLGTGEIISAIELPRCDWWARFEKTGKRRALDIASVNSALAVKLDGDRVADMRLAYGGVAPTAIQMTQVAQLVRGRRLTERLVREAAEEAARSVEPIDDVRGSAEFRRRLVRNHLIKHFAQLSADKGLGIFSGEGVRV